MARHMMIARMRPLEPSSAPAVMSSLLSRTNPIATADKPAYEFRIAMTVGMSAPPIGMMRRTPKRSARTMMTGKRPGAQLAAGWMVRKTPTTIATPSSARLLMFCRG
jgi:hypothetical protein